MAYGMAAWQMALIEEEKWRKAAWQSWRERQYQQQLGRGASGSAAAWQRK
jgi:hypothetical protein